MSGITVNLHQAFLGALAGHVLGYGDLNTKPLDLDLALPLPQHLRLYLYSLVLGGQSRPGEFKAVLRVPGQRVGEYGTFDYSGHRLAVLAAYREDLDVFVLWDASTHPHFKNGGNMQVKETVVAAAAATGRAEQWRPLRSGITEIVFACRSSSLSRTIADRVAWTGGMAE